jgi:hypothetical protein
MFDFTGKVITRLWDGYTHCPGHGDYTLDAMGNDVKVGRCDDNGMLANQAVVFNFETGKVSGTGLRGASHNSGRGWLRPGGWMVGSNVEEGIIVAMKIDGSRSEYIADARTVQPVDYWAQPQASASPLGTRVIFATNWGTGDPNDEDAQAFVADFRDNCK